MSKPKIAAGEQPPPEQRLDDEPVHVPKGQSRMRFILILGLMIFTLVIYVVPRQLQSIFERSVNGSNAYVSWKVPGHDATSLSPSQFQAKRRVFDSFLNMIGNERVSRVLLDDQNLARLLIIDEMAQDSGVDVSDPQIAKAMLEGQLFMIGDQFLFMRGFQDKKNFAEACNVFRVSPAEFQESLRTMMRIDRYERLLGFAMAQPDPDEYEKLWKKDHQERSFDFVAVDVSANAAEVAAQLPAEPELKTWYDTLAPQDKNRAFAAEWKPERISAELVGWRFDASAEPTALLAKYPRPEGADLEQLAKDYYNQFANVRFRRAQEKEGAADDHDRLYQSFDEVADAARRESKIHAALNDWQKSLKDRAAAGETIDLAAEASALGLTYRKEEPPKSQVDWNALPDFGGPLLTQKIMVAARGDKNIDVFVGEKDIETGRVLERLPAGPPPFEDVKDKVAEEWKKQRAVSMAQERMTQLYTLLAAKDPTTTPVETPPDEKPVVDVASFNGKVTAAGLTPVHVDWFDPTKLPTKLPENPTEVDRFHAEFRAAQAEYAGPNVKDGTLIGPRLDSERQHIWLARAGGVRDPEVVAIQPKDLEQLRANASQEAQRKFRTDVIGAKGIEKMCQLTFAKEHEGDTPKS